MPKTKSKKRILENVYKNNRKSLLIKRRKNKEICQEKLLKPLLLSAFKFEKWPIIMLDLSEMASKKCQQKKGKILRNAEI